MEEDGGWQEIETTGVIWGSLSFNSSQMKAEKKKLLKG